MSIRAKKRHRLGSLKEAQARLIKQLGGAKAVAAMTGHSRRQIERYADARSAAYFTANFIHILEQRAGRMYVTGWLAHAQGAALLHFHAGPSQRHMRAHFARIGRHAATLFAIYLEHAADGEAMSKAGAGEIVAAADELLSSVSDLRARASKVAGVGPAAAGSAAE